jgi:hypothetical protein
MNNFCKQNSGGNISRKIHPIPQLDLTMMIMTGGEERTESEWRNLLHSTGFTLTKVYMKEGQLDLIEAKPNKLL